jgi:cytochrome c oxidase subunit 2
MGHSTTEWVYVGTVIALLVWVGAESWRVEHTLEFAPPNSETVRAIGQQWFWSFQHADGSQEVNELHLKQNVPYRFEIVSNDVIHDFAIPDFAVLMDAVPGRVNTMWNIFDQPGEYLIECREYCGQGHHTMRAKLFIEPNNGTAPVTNTAADQQEKPSVSQGTGFASVINPLPNSSGAKVSTGTGFEHVINPPTLGKNTSSSSNASTSSSSASGGANGTAGGSGGPSVALAIPSGASVQGNPSYSPDKITAKKGDVITVTNNDNAIHTVTNGATPDDPQAGKLFDSSMIMQGKTAQIKTASLAPGDYPFHCTVHPYMKGTLTVTG